MSLANLSWGDYRQLNDGFPANGVGPPMPAHTTPVSSQDPDDFDHASAIEACALGDETAFRRLYDLESGRMLALAMRLLGSRDQAEDAVHDAFIKLWSNAGQYRRELGNGRAWLFTILRYRALDQLRAQGRTPRGDSEALDSLADLLANPEAAAHDSQTAHQLSDCLGELEAPRREPILLAFFKGLTHEQIAEKLSAPLGTIKGRIRAGLKRLQECLSR
ncbi:sigma-70 family RNA polymerase sigma factor [Cobetia marina]|uniref:Sigma-70 family RNA polymerase sigma factor n=2 Tax=Oceanospirillales TaxID=135619 RepID=A0ABU9GGT4_COBMA|nr:MULTISPECIES: sigma-70 family RNA polymerase sigma factor [Cobetia]MDA5562154.1 sigma-70 family RNA polymerase sigma factor [Cobetia sp. MMG027]MDH2290366.1 sigma-70 family RNA polymerase sigma factor [Cobetia sp. 10Alg 146]MDH2372289.1 sigma-70 family RNA polymerase sigma factor [Cobetia sp. 3AK]MDN2655211.1 sigma-70 family RNA polymerase sigma factor [Cobetia sp. 14N.309.X.WAT.E.A4]MDO6787976.1 sigma-70 family RNA polymerase sigma factor [Cobetia marina]